MKPRPLASFARWGSLTGAVVLMPYAPASAALPSSTHRLGACAPEMARAEELFPQAGGLRIVVTRFAGQDEPSEKMGAEHAYTLSQELPYYTRKSVKDDAQAEGLRGDDLHVQYVPCMMSSQAQAREVGRAWGADLIFWGQASCSRNDPLNDKLSPVVEKGAKVVVQVQGDVRAKGHVRIGIIDNRQVTVAAPPPRGLFKTSMTLVRWRGFDGRSDQAVTLVDWRGVDYRGDPAVRIDPAAASHLDFPRLASEPPLALYRWVMGVYAFYRQKYAVAATRFEEAAAELYDGAEDRSDLFRVMGTSYLYAGNPQRGLEALEQARMSCGSRDARCMGLALTNLGWAVDRLGDKQKALSYYEEALAFQKQVGDQATTLNNIGGVYADLGDKQKALSYYEKALPLWTQVGDRSGQASTLSNIGFVFFDLGEHSKALRYYEQALTFQKQVGDRSGEASTLSNIGLAFLRRLDKQKALGYYLQALTLRQQVGDRSGEASALSNIGLVCLKLWDRQKALSYYEQALTLRRQVGDRSGEASALSNIGLVLSGLKDKQKALSYLEQALMLRQQMGDRSGEASTLSNIGLVFSDLGDKQKALSYLEQALPVWRQVGDHSGEGNTLTNLAVILAWIGQPLQSIMRYREASTCYLARRPPETIEAKRSLERAFEVALRSKQWSHASKLLTELEALKPSELALARWQAQLAGHSGAADAIARYQELARLAAARPDYLHRNVPIQAQAGILRAQNRAHIADCPGVVITSIGADTQARLGLRIGDIVLSYQNQCIDEPAKFDETLQKTQPRQSVSLTYLRQDRPQILTTRGGYHAISTEVF